MLKKKIKDIVDRFHKDLREALLDQVHETLAFVKTGTKPNKASKVLKVYAKKKPKAKSMKASAKKRAPLTEEAKEKLRQNLAKARKSKARKSVKLVSVPAEPKNGVPQPTATQ